MYYAVHHYVLNCTFWARGCRPRQKSSPVLKHCPGAQWSGWVSIVQKIRIGNFWFCKLLWVQILANTMPLNDSYHFDTFDHNYWEINCLELCQNWVETPYLTILFSEQFQKKNLETWICGKKWTQIHVLHVGKGLPDM